MKKMILLLFTFISTLAFSQGNAIQQASQKVVGGGLGLVWIDNKPYYSFAFNPELEFGKIGVGLDVRFEFNGDGIRKENFNETSDYLSMVRYFRYGQKSDPFYLRLGALDCSNLGNGTIISNYNNRPTIDARKIGMEIAFDAEKFGFEALYGNFGMAGVVGARAFVRPLKFTTAADIPVLGNLEIGGTYAADLDKHAKFDYTVIGAKKDSTYGDGNISIVGFDVTLPLVKTNMLNVKTYYDFAKILNYGSGSAIGVKADLAATEAIKLGAKFEYRINGDEYIPGYFNSLYEIERYQASYSKNNDTVYGKASKLKGLKGKSGYFGELYGSLLKVIDIKGSYERIPDLPQSGVLHINANAKVAENYVARAGYDKIKIDGESAIFKLDENSLLYAELGYKPYKFMMVSMLYTWTFTPLREAGKDDGKIIGYETQKRIEPRVSFIYEF